MESLQGLHYQQIPVFWTPDRICSAEDAGRFVFNHMPVAADAARAGVRVRASLHPGHIGLCTSAFFSHKSLLQKSLICQQFLHTLYCFYN